MFLSDCQVKQVRNQSALFSFVTRCKLLPAIADMVRARHALSTSFNLASTEKGIKRIRRIFV